MYSNIWEGFRNTLIGVLFIAGVMLLIVIIGGLVLDQYLDMSSPADIQSSYNSPDGRYFATVFERDAGATSDFFMHIALREANRKFDPDRGVVFVRKGDDPIIVYWKDNRTMVVKYGNGLVIKSISTWRDVKIVYRQD